ncbi:CbtA family protein [Kitasatospora sp. NPDC048365]|uniref:CbtA family protein n=1 Tax=Kitasatospora sp. NPDC048365 TaxID=3364050 RepID=UPI003716EB38
MNNSISVRSLLVRGMLAGLVAGLLALAVAYVLGEPHIDAAIAFEESHAHDHGGGEEELVSRALQSTAGLATGVLVYAVALGGIAALAYAVMLGRIGRFSPRATAAVLAGAAFVSVYLVPFLKYPANPPAATDPATINERTGTYFLMIALSVLLALAATVVGRRLAPRLGTWWATVAAGAVFVALVAAAFAVLPSFDEVPEHFSAELLYRFRLSALAVQLTLWTAFGLVFGHLAERLIAPAPAAAAEPVPVA